MANLNSFAQYKGKGVTYENETNSVLNEGEGIKNTLEMRYGSKMREIAQTSGYQNRDDEDDSDEDESEDDEKEDKQEDEEVEEIQDNFKSDKEGMNEGAIVPYQWERPSNPMYTTDTLPLRQGLKKLKVGRR